jgi:hypothetical protein
VGRRPAEERVGDNLEKFNIEDPLFKKLKKGEGKKRQQHDDLSISQD